MLKLKLKKMSYNIGAFTWSVCDNDNGISGARNVDAHMTEINSGTAPGERGAVVSLLAEAFFYWLITC